MTMTTIYPFLKKIDHERRSGRNRAYPVSTGAPAQMLLQTGTEFRCPTLSSFS